MEDYIFKAEIALIVIGIIYVLIKPKKGKGKRADNKVGIKEDFAKWIARMNSFLGKLSKSTLPKWYGYHLLIYGSTGTGKSTYVEYTFKQIMDTIPNASFIVLNPHHRQGQWGLQKCIGGGREYGEIEGGIQAVLELMNTRYQQYYADSKVKFNDVFLVIDELPAITANTKKGVVSEALKQISSEARKVNIWLVVLSQSKLVKQLGFERASDMLENFCMIEVNKPYVRYSVAGKDYEDMFRVVKVDISDRVSL